ncbi:MULTISPECIES: type II toxin-antitoxin system RelE/ParE family toxin [Erwiniaceae]|uniref:Type II toxin-antitoxin system RelE/ParE family toxin n=1 Tax=Enterobacter agglomerans TaxID=549 RepID=A0ACC5RSV7_ENTAG|nr:MULTISPECIES: type II toxin-antitoxin system RelE/ParE family toxin [Erwiniaceae]MBK4727646.1 type II toxin-antitoxin system RelE/ParE family toxin [Pantoea agglomerans]MBP2152572.1 phage-related protein [Erwinia rhapontici]NKG28523.1 type II toxin-antitoxin system RelE/ParE family toxin [Erwinia rhapontici]
MKKICFLGSSLSDLKRFPRNVMHDAGYQLAQLQAGATPADFKSLAAVASGVWELRIHDGDSGTFRVVYVSKLRDAIYVLHAFHKKTLKTSPQDVALVRQRYQQLIQEFSS